MQKPKRFSLPADHADVAPWAIAALVCGALAVVAVNLSTLLPANALSGLHTPYREGANYHQIRALLDELTQDRNRVMGDYRALLARFNLLDDDSSETIRRLAAVEKSLPLLIESLPLSSDIDRSLLTASISEAAEEVYEFEGGTMVVRYSPLFDEAAPQPVADQPMPPPLAPEQPPATDPEPAVDLTLQGIAVGRAVPIAQSSEIYAEISRVAGALLLGTSPLAAAGTEPGQSRVILGPLPDLASAQALCARIERLDLPCDPAPYSGEPLPL
ncbi:hypothetical protein [Pelagibacterium halotolerans]|uniref:Uncharacterized protein n=1 Tax=Pelagibacterium halotolerans (strain DSM 22347 / JCM 15775 / CGMCC 1.7692 / B2) TaxID=1082931 RepID=G4R9P8_PELHB|nr:hypothetical protein [Pelagibacterium halotolerans]AEQ51455.1 hypothetical protein KKY_1434 [Pelagibacterium halotolerans B2]QJR18703.1 hypothetical protein HKM20_09800 [Pelagibacterium halotolerans]SEA14012.1 hypothetical protein SAMN05428936_10271 [Pelagibacterium halotolerans]